MLLEVAGDDSGLVTEMIDAFVTDVVKRLRLALDAMVNSDAAALQYQVHSIKGSSKQMEVWAVAALSEEIETACRERRPIAQLSELVKELETQLQEVCAAMAGYRARN
jgi:HPt (histidine-containing phosphotransfer) domain-containing protein